MGRVYRNFSRYPEIKSFSLNQLTKFTNIINNAKMTFTRPRKRAIVASIVHKMITMIMSTQCSSNFCFAFHVARAHFIPIGNIELPTKTKQFRRGNPKTRNPESQYNTESKHYPKHSEKLTLSLIRPKQTFLGLIRPKVSFYECLG